jgi:protein gp37
MGSKIEWTDVTWNPVLGCTPVSPGCLNCYAARQCGRGLSDSHKGLTVKHNGRPTFNGEINLVEKRLKEPFHWKKPRMVFVNSMSDLFHEGVPDSFIDKVFAVMAVRSKHRFQVLTKRPERMRQYVKSMMRGERKLVEALESLGVRRFIGGFAIGKILDKGPLKNVWLGTSVEDQKTADERVPALLGTPASVRFLSCEPLLGEVDLRTGVYGSGEGFRGTSLEGIGWVIVGGESGPNSRRCEYEWVKGIVAQCRWAGVKVFVKQMGANAHCGGFRLKLKNRKGADPTEWPQSIRIRQMPEVCDDESK